MQQASKGLCTCRIIKYASHAKAKLNQICCSLAWFVWQSHVCSRQASVKSNLLTLRLTHAGCNLRLVKALAKGLPILYNHVVKEVKYDQAGVRVTAGNTVIAGAIHITERATALFIKIWAPAHWSFCFSVQLSDLCLPARSACCFCVPSATASSCDVPSCSQMQHPVQALLQHCPLYVPQDLLWHDASPCALVLQVMQ